MCATDEGKEKGEKWCKRAIWENTLPEVKHVWKSVDNLTSGVFVKMWQDQVDRFYTIASPRSNITAFLGVTVNGVRVVVTLMLRPGTTVSVADVTPRPPEPDAAESSKQHKTPGFRHGSQHSRTGLWRTKSLFPGNGILQGRDKAAKIAPDFQ